MVQCSGKSELFLVIGHTVQSLHWESMDSDTYLDSSGLHAPDNGFAGGSEQHRRWLQWLLLLRIPQTNLGGGCVCTCMQVWVCMCTRNQCTSFAELTSIFLESRGDPFFSLVDPLSVSSLMELVEELWDKDAISCIWKTNIIYNVHL